MKNLKSISIAVFCLMAAIMVSSCGIMKNNDFSTQKYTNFKKGKSTVNIKQVNIEKKNADLYPVVSDKKELAENIAVADGGNSQTIKTSNPEIKNGTIKPMTHINIIPKVKIKPTSSFAMNRLVNRTNTTSYNTDGHGLSFFWIVILVVLIIWALGLGFGLGGLINVLLVIALVLLILWLLEVV